MRTPWSSLLVLSIAALATVHALPNPAATSSCPADNAACNVVPPSTPTLLPPPSTSLPAVPKPLSSSSALGAAKPTLGPGPAAAAFPTGGGGALNPAPRAAKRQTGLGGLTGGLLGSSSGGDDDDDGSDDGTGDEYDPHFCPPGSVLDSSYPTQCRPVDKTKRQLAGLPLGALTGVLGGGSSGDSDDGTTDGDGDDGEGIACPADRVDPNFADGCKPTGYAGSSAI